LQKIPLIYKYNMIQIIQCWILYFLYLGVYSQDTVNQSPSAQHIAEGHSFQITCTYKTSSFYAMQWYQQNRNEGLKYINKVTSSRTYGDDAGKFKPTVDTSSKSGSLTIKPSLSDSGTYYCAIEPHIATKNTSA
uniref:Ig-like domain-containing protein n=1 Tax=Erpetoichthys calabaricus TaxID=27687 RepID=A0A8C4XDL5_ERPCA